MRYVQCLLKNKNAYQLRWLPEKFALEDKILKIEGLWGTWDVKEVYRKEEECVMSSNKCIWDREVNPYLEGDKLNERLYLYKKMIKIHQIEEV